MSQQLVVFDLDGGEYALPVTVVREIAKLGSLIPIPDSLPFLKGMIYQRGEAIPVVDLHARLGLEQSHCPFALIVEGGGARLLALAVNSVKGVSVLGEIQAAPNMVSTPCVSGLIKLPDRVIIVLDLHIVLEVGVGKSLEQINGI